MSLTLTGSQPQYRRQASLFFTNSQTGNGREITDLHFMFKTTAREVETPNQLVVRIYNPAPDTINSIINEFDRVSLQAGYKNPGPATIFTGDVVEINKGREANKDNFLEVVAADGDFAYNSSFGSFTLDGAVQEVDVLKSVAEAMGVILGPGVADLVGGDGGTTPDPRGKVFFGLNRLYVRTLADTLNCVWSIQNGVLQMTRRDGYLPDEAVVLTPQTGLIGSPELTLEGVQIRALLNPRLKIGGRVSIEDRFINQTTFTPGFSAGTVKLKPRIATLSPDGIYRIMVHECTGDTRGQDYYSDLICLAVDPTKSAVSTAEEMQAAIKRGQTNPETQP